MKRLLPLLALAVVLWLPVSCLKESVPTSSATEQQVLGSAEALSGLLNGLTTQMVMPYLTNNGTATSYAYDFGYPALMIMLDTVAGEIVLCNSDSYDWFLYWARNSSSMGPDARPTATPWVSLYKFVSTCNDVISILDGDTSGRETNEILLGEALAYRAFFYLTLARMYEFKPVTDPSVKASYAPSADIAGLTVPIVTHDMNLDDITRNPRATAETMYTFILSDLSRAEALLQGKTPAGKVHPDLAVVYGLQARTWLWLASAGDETAWAKAADAAAQAVNTFGGTPLTQEQWEAPTTGFNNYAANSNAWMWYLPQDESRVQNLASFVANMANEETWTSYGWLSARGISRQLYNRIPDSDWRKHSWIDPTRDLYYAYKTNRDIFGETSSVDKGLPSYANIKFRPAGGDCETYKGGGAADIPLMRVEEMQLIRAEALAMGGDLEGGKAVLNSLIQTRNPAYDCASIATAGEFQQEVFFQKRIELWGEGQIFFDCKRLGTGINNGYTGTNALPRYRYNVTGVAPNWNFVIPRDEVLGNPAVAGQNNPDPTNTLTLWTE